MPTSFFDSDLDSFFLQLQRHNRERVLTPPPAGVLDLCSNDYLGLSQHPQIIAALHEGIERYGAGSTASRLVRGHRSVFDELEHRAAEWLGGEAALYFANGYAANVGVISAVCDGSYAAFIDRFAHASLVDGVRLSGARKTYFRHNDMEHLRQLLVKSDAKKHIIISESVFSMDGDEAPLGELVNLAEEFDALLYIDDAHATGVLGPQGRGLAPLTADFRLATLGKALGLEGAVVVTSARARRFLLHAARTFVFSTAPLPAIAHAALTAMEVARSMDRQRGELLAHADLLRKAIAHAGYSSGNSATQIVPLLCESERHALDLSERLLQEGFHAKAIRPPTVKESRIRFSLNARVTGADVARLSQCLANR
ncbi:MAG: aminotransferase class I/II-fold pyridoxal phosphate-dependent enzyme [Turneriella sp.]